MLIKINKSAVKDLKKLDKHIANKIIDFIETLEKSPNPLLLAEPLVNHEFSYRFKTGDYRLLAEICDDIIIFRVIHRRNAYRKF